MFLACLITLATPIYTQAKFPVDVRVRDLVARMTLEEKARQLDMYSGTAFVDKKLDNTHTAPDAQLNEPELAKELGNLGAGSIHDLYPTAEIASRVQRWVIEHNRLHIPALFIEEGVHGYDGFGAWPKEAIQAHIGFMRDINKELREAGELISAEGLADPKQAVIVRAGTNGAPVTDGVFPESKEFLAGWWIIDVESPARAHAVAAKASAAPGPGGAPLNMPIEVRQVMSGPPEEFA